MDYEYNFIGYAPEYGTANLNAATREEADIAFKQYISEFYPELQDVEITEVKEI